MFDIGWTEIMVIACVAIIVVGPKDLPRMLRTLGQTIGKVRRMSREFQSTFNDAIREAEKQAGISDMKKQVEDVGNLNPLADLKKSIEDDKPVAKPDPAKPARVSAAAAGADNAASDAAVPDPNAPNAEATSKKPAAKKPAAKKPAVKKAVAKKPAVKKPAATAVKNPTIAKAAPKTPGKPDVSAPVADPSAGETLAKATPSTPEDPKA